MIVLEARERRTRVLVQVFCAVYAVGFGAIALSIARGDFTSHLYDVVNLVAPSWVWAVLYALGAVGFAAEAAWPACRCGPRVWALRVGLGAVMFALIVRGVGLLLSPVFGEGTLVNATPAGVAWLMIAATVSIHVWGRGGVR